jgi:hypothetical protein
MLEMMRGAGIAALAVLLVLAAGPSAAEPQLQPGRGAVPLSGTSWAARQSGVAAWGRPRSNEAVCHVVLALRRHDAGLFLQLPRRISNVEVTDGLQRVAAALGWPDPELAIYRRPYGVYGAVITADGPHNAGWLRSRIPVHLARLLPEIARLNPRAPVFCVRTLGVIDEPPVGMTRPATYGPESFVFLTSTTVSATEIEFGVPKRWLAAALSTLALWCLLPVGLAAAAARFLRDRKLSPADYLGPYRRWNVAIRVIGLLLAGLTLAALAPGAATFTYLGRGGSLFSRALWLLLLPHWFLQGLLLQLALPLLTRGLPAQRVSHPWLPAGDGAALLALLAALFGPIWSAQSGGSASVAASAAHWIGLSFVLGSLPLYMLAVRASFQKLPRLWRTEIPEDLPASGPALGEAIRELAARCADENEEEPVELARVTPLLRAIYRALRALDPLDRMMLRVSTQLAIRSARPLVRLLRAFVWSTPTSLLLPGLWLMLRPPANYSKAVQLIFLLFVAELAAQRLAWRAIQGRTLDRERAADERVVAAIGDRQRMIGAMRIVVEQLREARVPMAWLSLEKRLTHLEAGD